MVQDCAHAAQEHLAGLRQREDDVVKTVEVVGRAGGVASGRGRTAVKRMALATVVRHIQWIAAPVALAPGGVHVEGDVAPELIAEGVAIHAHVGPHVVVLRAPARASEMVDHFGHVEHVEDGVAADGEGRGFVDAVGQREIVGWNWIGSRRGNPFVRRHFLKHTCAEEVGLENAYGLVERASRIVAHPFHLFLSDDVVVEGELVKFTIEL